MIETPTAVFDVRAIAGHPRVNVLVVGTNDLARELRVPLGVAGRSNLTPYLANAVLAAREAGRVIVDGVFNDVEDPDGFAAECRQGVDMGFDGKTLIHPDQVEPGNAAWTPTDDDVETGGAGHRRLQRRLVRRPRRRHRRRSDGRGPPRRQCPPHAGDRRRHRRALVKIRSFRSEFRPDQPVASPIQ